MQEHNLGQHSYAGSLCVDNRRMSAARYSASEVQGAADPGSSDSSLDNPSDSPNTRLLNKVCVTLLPH